MKTWTALFESVASFENLHVAYRRARRGKRSSADVARFELDAESRLLGIRRDLLAGGYRFGEYREFQVYEPKQRLVSAAPFRDRVVHHAIVSVLEPIYEPRFVHDTYACRRDRGTHRAILRCQEFARSHPLVLKADILKFYPSVDHQVLLAILARRIRDPRLLALIASLLHTWTSGPEYHRDFAGDDLFAVLRPRGIPIGNLTSQFFANVYLAELDAFVKRGLRVKAYVRYMDDVLLFGDDRHQLRAWKRDIGRAIEPLRLTLHPVKCHVHHTAAGVPFLGFRALPGRRLLLRKGVQRFIRRTRRQYAEVQQGERTPAALGRSIQAWVAHASFAESGRLRRAIWPRLFQRGRWGRVDSVVPGVSGRFVEQRCEQPPLRRAQQQQPEQSQQQHRVPLCEDVLCLSPARRGGQERALNVHGSFPAREGHCEQDGSPCGRPLAEAWRPGSTVLRSSE